MSVLDEKVAVIAGAGGGIGRAVARLFARAGAKLVVNDLGTDIAGQSRDPSVVAELAEELIGLGASVVADASDIASDQGVASVMNLAKTRFGRLDVLVNCAGILREHALLNMRCEDLAAVLDVHVLGTFRLMKAAAALMREGGGGRIVNTTSQSALQGNTGQSSNSAASAAVVGLTRSAAVELQRYRIYVNAVAPLAKTRQTEALPLFQKATGLAPEHVAAAYLFLASDAAGTTSGEVLTIAGSRLSALRVGEQNAAFVETGPCGLGEREFAKAWSRLAD